MVLKLVIAGALLSLSVACTPSAGTPDDPMPGVSGGTGGGVTGGRGGMDGSGGTPGGLDASPSPDTGLPSSDGNAPATDSGAPTDGGQDGGNPATSDCTADAPDSLFCKPTGPMPKSIKGTGLFTKLPDFSQHAKSLMEFKPSPELWSDGMGKQRFILLPSGKKIDNTESTRWEFPVGTVFVKTFFDDSGPGGTPRPIETRFIRRIGDILMGAFNEYDYHVYQWNADGTDAMLVIDEMTDETKVIPVDVTINRIVDGRPFSVNEGKPFKHDLPSREMCKGCHEESGMEGGQTFIGFDEVRLNWKLNADRPKTQLEEFADAGFFTKQLPPEPATIADPDPRLSRIKRGVFGNCAHCHMGIKVFDLRPNVFVENTVKKATEAQSVEAASGLAACGSGQSRNQRALSPDGANQFAAPPWTAGTRACAPCHLLAWQTMQR